MGLWLTAPAGIEAQIHPEVVEEVVVTGRWIPGRPEDAALPVTQTTHEEMRLEGSPGVIDMLRNLSFSQGADGESDQYGSRTGADRATVNLRGLGPSRSLVLLNSRRLPLSPGSIPDQAQLVVDVNLLPFAALQSMEVLRDGAAATYGSDAIAGVVNFITRSDYEGIEVEARHKAVDGSAGDDRLALIAGSAFGGGAGHLVTSIGYAQRAPLAMPGAKPSSAAGAATARSTAFANLVQETRRWQWFTEGSWAFTSDLRVSGELLLAETEVPRWGTSPSYPPSEVIDLSRRIQASNPALVDMAAKYPDLYGGHAWCEARTRRACRRHGRTWPGSTAAITGRRGRREAIRDTRRPNASRSISRAPGAARRGAPG